MLGSHFYFKKNIFSEGELLEDSVVKKFFTTAGYGEKYKTNFYNLDAIISVGYRVKSRVATRFRIWATQRLREYIIKGFVLDELCRQNGVSRDRVPTLMNQSLLADIRDLIFLARRQVAQAVNARPTMLYWEIRRRIRQDIPEEKRAAYGKEIVAALRRQLAGPISNP